MSGTAAYLQTHAKNKNQYLTSSPEISFFNNVYKRYTNFSLETIEEFFSGSTDSTMTLPLSNHGDLISNIYLKVNITASITGADKDIGEWGWIKNLGHTLIDSLNLKIGNEPINNITAGWLNIHHEIYKDINTETTYNEMTGNIIENTKIQIDSINPSRKNLELYIPIPFYFSQKYDLALPCVALFNDNITIDTTFIETDLLYNKTKHSTFDIDITISNPSLLIDYILLDTIERNLFRNKQHEYWIEIIDNQSTNLTSNKDICDFTFLHPTKCLFWGLNSSIYNNKENTQLIQNTYLCNGDIELATKRFILSFFTHHTNPNSNQISIGDTFTYIITDATYTTNPYSTTFDMDIHLKLIYRSIYNTNNKDIYDIVTSAYYNNITDKDLKDVLLSDIVVPELLPIEIASLDGRFFDPTNTNYIFESTVYRMSNTTSQGYSDYDIYLHDFSNYGIYIDGTGNPISSVTIKINGNTHITNEFSDMFYNKLQPYQYFNSSPNDGIYCYSFALYPLQHHPTGTINFSQINKLEFHLNHNTLITNNNFYTDTDLHVYSLYYNKLIIKDMKGKLLFQ